MILQIKTFQIESAVSGLINYKGDLYTCNFASIIFKIDCLSVTVKFLGYTQHE